MSVRELTQEGKELGYEGEELRQFVREQQAFARAEREAARTAEQARLQAEREAAREQAEREREAAREQAEREAARQQAEREARRVELELQVRLAEVNGANAQRGAQNVVKTPSPKLPKFEEGKDDMDAFLERFERFARAQNWPEEGWAVSVSSLLTGAGLQVYATLSALDANDYNKLKAALLKRYDLNEEGYRRRFRESKPKGAETPQQFMSKLGMYLDRWIEMTGTENSFEGVKDLILREQFLSSCHEELATYLRERMPEVRTREGLAKLAEQYVDAHECTIGSRVKRRSEGQGRPINSKPKPVAPVGSKPQGGNGTNRTRQVCFLCQKPGHYAKECRATQQKQRAAGAQVISNKDKDMGAQKGAVREEPDQTPQSESAAACQATERLAAIEECMQDGSLRLANGEAVPIVSGACGQHSQLAPDSHLPICEGFIGDRRVEVLRDTGCSTAAVRSSLVKPDEWTGEAHMCVLIDGTIRWFPLARLWVDTPCFVGEVQAMGMKEPICDLIIGNVPGVKDVEEAVNDGGEIEREVQQAQAVVTRAQAKKADKPTTPLVVARIPEVQKLGVQELKQAQEGDASLQKLWELAKEGKQLTTKGGCRYRYAKQKGVLYRVFEEPRGEAVVEVKQIVVPEKLRKQVMGLAHESIVGGHLGSKKTLDRITTSFHWPGICSDVVRFCQSCDTCQKMIPKGKVQRVPMGKMPIMDTPFQRVAVDIIGPLAPISERGNRYILTVVDYATRYPEAIPLRKIDTESVAEALLEVFCRVGFPAEVLSDRGAQFTSGLMQEIGRLVRVKQIFTTPYNPRCNGLCERVNGVLKAMLKKMCQEKPQDWDRYLPAVLFAFREVPQASTGFSPFELLYGRTVRGPMQVLKGLWTEEDPPEVRNTYEYVLDLRNRLEETCELARTNLLQAQGKQKHHYDKRAKNRKFKVGQKVLVLLPSDHNKLLLQWRGPYEVIDVVSQCDYKIKVGGKPKVYHANLLKQYTERVEKRQEVAAAAIIEPAQEVDGVVDDENLLQLKVLRGSETYKDVIVNLELTQEQRAEAKALVKESSHEMG